MLKPGGDPMTATVLRMPTRTAEVDLPPCRTTWGHGCPLADGKLGAHTCWTWSGWPHPCRCMRCGRGDR
jgi:hypothetical protein